MPALDTVCHFPTPEHIAFTFRIAGPMVRLCAWLIDVVLRMVVLGVLLLISAIIGFKAGFGLWLFAYFLLDWFMGAYLEWRWNGTTPGKRMFGIRVIGADGLPADFSACLLRNLLRFADSVPSVATALVAMIASGRFQRLGDLAAGTLVVYDERPALTPLPTMDESGVADLARELPPATARVVDGAVLRGIVAYVARRRSFHPQRRNELAEPLALALMKRLDLAPTIDHDRLLCAVYHRLAINPEHSAGASAVAYCARRQDAWNQLDSWSKTTPPRVTSADDDQPPPVRHAALYRGACADLALADAYHLPERTVHFLHNLVARTHVRFHRHAGTPGRRLWHLVLVEVPGRLYGDVCLRLALGAFFGTFVLCMLFGMAQPGTVEQWLGHDVVDSLRDMYADSPDHRQADEAVTMAGHYVNNNVGIALACFASGIFAGVGSLVWLAANGVFLGLIFGFMATVDPATRDHFFTFVTAHGPFELTGITLAGAAGMRMGLGLVQTRGLSRGAALLASAREAVPIVVVAAVLVALAAPIEAFVSPSAVPVETKRAVAVVSVLALIVYLVGLGWRAQRQTVTR